MATAMIRMALLTAVVGACLGLPAVTSASTVTVGSPLTASFVPQNEALATVANSALSETGANVTSPVTGRIVRWRILGASGGFKLRVLTPKGGTTYAGAGTSASQSPTSAALQTFSTNMPIQAGQTVGLDDSNNGDIVGVASVAGSSYLFWNPPLADGSASAAGGSIPNGEVAFNADVVAQPGVVLLSPVSGPTSGGTTVTIAGHDLLGASAVNFGSRPATSFSVASDSEIRAISPPGAVGAVDVTIVAPGGQSTATAADRFTYTACVVPKLKGKTVNRARERLKAANCTVGLINKPKHGKKLVVKAQSPASGAVRPAGEPVSIKLGPKPHHKKH
jgi:hypothetical protein